MKRSISSFLGTVVLIAAACQPTPPPVAAAPDSATIHAALQAEADSYAAAELAADAAAVGQQHTEGASMALEGLPTMTGRANIEAGIAAGWALEKVTGGSIKVEVANAATPTTATAGGTASFEVDSAGTPRTRNWRWAAEYQLGTDGRWRISYLMALKETPPTATP